MNDKTLSEMRKIMNRHDPIRIYFGKKVNFDEYDPKINEIYKDQFDAVFGPAYKGIPLAVSVSIALQKDLSINKPCIFDRKEKKTHGDASAFVGPTLDLRAKYIIVDDVMTTGETKLEAVLFWKGEPMSRKKLAEILTGPKLLLASRALRERKKNPIGQLAPGF